MPRGWGCPGKEVLATNIESGYLARIPLLQQPSHHLAWPITGTVAREEAGPPSTPMPIPCLTHSAGWAGWHPQAWFSAGVGAVCICTRSRSPGKRDNEHSWVLLLLECKVLSAQPTSVTEAARTQAAHPPQPNEDPVGLCPGSLLIGSKEVLHHGDPPAR